MPPRTRATQPGTDGLTHPATDTLEITIPWDAGTRIRTLAAMRRCRPADLILPYILEATKGFRLGSMTAGPEPGTGPTAAPETGTPISGETQAKGAVETGKASEPVTPSPAPAPTSVDGRGGHTPAKAAHQVVPPRKR